MNIQDIASASALIKQELAPLAERIGEGAEYTFELFVRQAYVNAITGMLWLVPGIILAIITSKLYYKATTLTQTSEDYEYKEVYYFMSAAIGSFALIMILPPISRLIGVLINPEYRAIELIITTLKGTI